MDKNIHSLFSDLPVGLSSAVYADGAPINGYRGYLRPQDDREAKRRGDICVSAVKANMIGDFERNETDAEREGTVPDRMVHVSTFTKIGDMIYMTYYANTSTGEEDPKYQEARLAFCREAEPENKTILCLQKVGDVCGGKTVTAVYDTVLMQKDEDVLFLLWTAALDGMYYRLYRTFDVEKRKLGDIGVNRLQVGDITVDFSTEGIKGALAENHIPQKRMFNDIGIMQKLSVRKENGEDVFYTGAYSGFLNFIVKSRDFVTWEYVSAPDFVNFSKWENAVYVLSDRVYYFVRQDECMQGFLTYYDLTTKKWQAPTLISDCGSRSDFLLYDGRLYLISAPKDRNGFGITKICTDDLMNSVPVLVADFSESCFYPYTKIYDGQVYVSYTVDRKHIRLSHFPAELLGTEETHA